MSLWAHHVQIHPPKGLRARSGRRAGMMSQVFVKCFAMHCWLWEFPDQGLAEKVSRTERLRLVAGHLDQNLSALDYFESHRYLLGCAWGSQPPMIHLDVSAVAKTFLIFVVVSSWKDNQWVSAVVNSRKSGRTPLPTRLCSRKCHGRFPKGSYWRQAQSSTPVEAAVALRSLDILLPCTF